MILAAGRGTRMAPLTDDCPKPLLPLAGKALIEHHIEALALAGITELLINCAYLGEMIEDRLGDGERYGVHIVYSHEPEPLETAGGILRALPQLSDGGSPFIVVNGDVWTDFDFSTLSLRGLLPGERGHLVMVTNPDHNPDGDFCLSAQGQLAMDTAADRYTFSGISLLSPALFEGCEPGVLPLLPVLQRAMADGALSGQLYRGGWIDVGTPERLQQLQRRLTV